MVQRTPTQEDLEAAARSYSSLSARQKDVLDLLADGKTNPQIADHLGITLDGAKWHVSQVLWKLGFTSREEAAAYRHWQLARRQRVWPPAQLRDPRWTAVTVFLILCIVAFSFTKRGGGDTVVPHVEDEPKFAEVLPSGEDVPRLSVIEIKFADAQDSDDPAELVTIEPAIDGTYSWAAERTLVFQPAFPGFLRGQRYKVSVKDKSKTGVEATVTESFVTEGLLTVDAVIPADGDSEVPAAAEIYVQFSRSVAPLTVISELKDVQIVTFEPAIAGKGEWLNTSLYHFTPDALAPSTTYTASIAAGLTSAADGVLEEDFSWRFSTYGPAIDSVFPDFNMHYASPRQEVTVRFNQPMSRTSVEAAFAMRPSISGSSTPTTPGTFAWSEGDSVVTFTPSEDLKLLTSYQVDIAKGLLTADGQSETKNSRTIVFTTIGAAKIALTRPRDGATAADRYGIEIRFANPMNTESMEDLFTVSGFESETFRTWWDEEDKIVWVDIALVASTDYTVKIAEGGENIAGFPLGAYEFSFTTGQLTPSVIFATPSDVGTYSSNVEPMLYYRTTNMEEVEFKLYQLTRAQAERFWRDGTPSQPGRRCYTPDSAPIRTWTEKVDGPLNEVVTNSTTLSGGGPLPVGDYYVQSGCEYWGRSLAFSIVDTEIVLKSSQDELLAWVFDHDTGQPIRGAAVSAEFTHYNNNLSESLSGVTNANGLVSFEHPANPTDGRYVVTVDGGGRHGVASDRWQRGAYPWELGIPVDQYQRKFLGFLYTERPIYRTGETVFYKAVVRVDDDAANVVPDAGSQFNLVITDSRGKDLAKEVVTINEYGTIAGSFELPSDAATGDYYVRLETVAVADGWRYVADTSFLVAEFRVPEFEVEVTADGTDYSSGDEIEVTVDATFFFGGFVNDAVVDWTVMASPASPLRIEDYERYSFWDWDYFRSFVSETPVRATGSGSTNTRGQFTFTVPAELIGDEGAQDFTISATVLDASGQAVANSTTVTVHAGDLYAGVRGDSYVAVAGEETGISLVTVTKEGEFAPGTAVTVYIYDRIWVTTKEQSGDGGRRYHSEPVDTLLTTLQTTTNALSEGRVTFVPENPGTIRIVAEVTDSTRRTTRTAAFMWVTGQGFASWRVTNDDLIELIADKDLYDLGDTATVLVPAPFDQAIGLVTVERGRILSREVRAFPSNNESLEIPITAKSLPNVYVSVVLYRAPTAEDPLPRYKLGYVELPVSTESLDLNIEIQPDRDIAEPGDSVSYDLTVTDRDGNPVQAELSVAVVDKAVLSLQEERSGDGLQAFWFQRPLGVITSSSLSVSVERANDLVVEPEGGGKGGGGLLEDNLRSEFKNTAFWVGQIETDADGKATVTVDLPDNLTTWRLQARAVSGDTLVGEGLNELLSTEPLLVRPALPRFLRVGDAATVRALVQNGTADPLNVSVTLTAEGVATSGRLTSTQTVKPGESSVFAWPVEAEATGTARFTFAAETPEGLRDAVQISMPVYLDVTPETTATGGVVTTTPQIEALFLPDYAILEDGTLSATVQPTLAGNLSGELEQLAPIFLEGPVRTASRLIATVAAARANQSAGINEDYHARVESDVAKLIGSQHSDGGWAWCPPCSSDPNITGWVLIALGHANAEGYAVPSIIASRSRTFVNSHTASSTFSSRATDPNQQAFLLYAQTLHSGQYNLSKMRALFEQHRVDLANWGRAYLMMGIAMHSDVLSDDAQVRGLFNDLAADMIPSANGNHWEDEHIRGSMHTNERTTALVLESLVKVSPSHPLIEETVKWLVVARGAGSYSTDVERSQAIHSLSLYGIASGELAGDFDYSVSIGTDAIMSGHFVGSAADVQVDSKVIDLVEFEAGSTSFITFDRDTEALGRMYYALDLRYQTPAKEVAALNRGIAVAHRYSSLDEPDVQIDSAELGEIVRVTLTVMTDRQLNYLVVDDLLPAGFEAIDPDLAIVDRSLIAQLEAERREAVVDDDLGYWAPWYFWYYSPWQHTDIRDDRVTLYANKLPRGLHTFVYFVRATTVGDFFVAPAYAEETYFPEVFGRSDSGRFTVED